MMANSEPNPSGRTLWTTSSAKSWIDSLGRIAVDDGFEYRGKNTPVTGRCIIHHSESVAPRFADLRSGRGIGCGHCKPSQRKWTTAAVVEFLATAHPDFVVDPAWELATLHDSIPGRCRRHGVEASAILKKLLSVSSRGFGCHNCASAARSGGNPRSLWRDLAEHRQEAAPALVYLADYSGTHGAAVKVGIGNVQRAAGIKATLVSRTMPRILAAYLEHRIHAALEQAGHQRLGLVDEAAAKSLIPGKRISGWTEVFSVGFNQAVEIYNGILAEQARAPRTTVVEAIRWAAAESGQALSPRAARRLRDELGL
ncbi:MAG: hypothetical protein GY882_07845 [Actinomycetia bacterium]|nr:hypothetical protein [Actinomycetes bacterium]